MPTLFDPTMLFGGGGGAQQRPRPAATPFDNMSTAEMQRREQELLRRLSPNFQAITGQSLASSLPGTPPSGTEQQLIDRLSPNFQAITGQQLAATMPGMSSAPPASASPQDQHPLFGGPRLLPNPAQPVGPMPGQSGGGVAPVEDQHPIFGGPRLLPNPPGSPPASPAVASQSAGPVMSTGPFNVPPGAANVVPSGANVMDMPNTSDTYGGPPGMSFMAAPNPANSGNFTNQLFANAFGTGAPGMWNEIAFTPPPVSARTLQEEKRKADLEMERTRSASESSDRALDRQTQLEIARMQNQQRGQLSPEDRLRLDLELRPGVIARNPNAPPSRIDELVREEIDRGLGRYAPPAAPGAAQTPGGAGGNRPGNVLSDLARMEIAQQSTPQAALAEIMRSNPAAGEFINSNWDAVQRELVNKYGQAAVDTLMRGNVGEGLSNPIFVRPGQNPTLEQQVISAVRNRVGGPQYGARPGERGIASLGRLTGLSSPFGLLHPLNPLSPLNRLVPQSMR
jgi:hypothetical protein